MYNSNYNNNPNYADNNANNANTSVQWQQQQPYAYNQGQPGYGAPPVAPAPPPGIMSPSSSQSIPNMPNTYASSPAPYPAYGQPPVAGHGQPGSYGSQLPFHQAIPAFGAQPQYQSPAAYIPPASIQPGAYNAPPPPGQGFPPQGNYTSPTQSAPIYLGARLAVDPLQPYATIPTSLPGYDPSQDVEIIRKATKGFGTDENALNRVLCLRAADQIQVLAQAYKARHGKDLLELLKKETSGYYETTLCLLTAGPLLGDVQRLRESIAGAGTNETLVTEILVGRHPHELVMLREAYKKEFNRSMDQDVLDDLSLKTKDAFTMILNGQWHDNGCVDINFVQRDVQELIPAFRLGFTNEMLISSIIFARSPTHLKALTEQFKVRNGKSLTNQIKQHFSGHLQEALLFAVEGGKRDGLGIWKDAKRLHQAMKGAGTADLLLLTRLVRAHWDANRFGQIKLAFKQKYKTDLVQRVRQETSGHYRDCLVTLINGV